MKRRLLFTLAGALAFSMLGLIPAVSQDKAQPAPAEEKKAQPAPAEEKKAEPMPDMKADQHKALAKLAGTFDTVIKIWNDPTKDAQEVKSTSKRDLVLGGYFLRESYEMTSGPYPHAGEITFGYNTSKKKLTFCHLASMNPEMLVHETEWDGKAKTFEFKFSSSMEWQGQKMDFTSRYVYTLESDDKQKMELFTVYPGMKLPGSDKEMGEIKEVEVTYTRKK